MLLEMRLNFVHLFRVPVLSCSKKKEILSAVLSSNGLCSLVPSGATVFWRIRIQRQGSSCRPVSLKKNYTGVTRREIGFPRKITEVGTLLQAFAGGCQGGGGRHKYWAG